MYSDVRYCPSNEIIEAYSLQQVFDIPLASLEEHLLVCCDCQDRLTLTDTYVATVRTALAKVDDTRQFPFYASSKKCPI
jgi:hypothetical protein